MHTGRLVPSCYSTSDVCVLCPKNFNSQEEACKQPFAREPTDVTAKLADAQKPYSDRTAPKGPSMASGHRIVA